MTKYRFLRRFGGNHPSRFRKIISKRFRREADGVQIAGDKDKAAERE